MDSSRRRAACEATARTYTFTKVFSETTSQAEYYAASAAPMVTAPADNTNKSNGNNGNNGNRLRVGSPTLVQGACL
eukprot:7328342-Pyramimonas_sp.AAC.1